MDAANDLIQPLGLHRGGPRPGSRWWAILQVAVIGAGCAAVVGFVGAALYGDPMGGRPLARAEIVAEAPASLPAALGPDAVVAAGAAAEPPRRAAETVEAASGVSVVRPAGTSAPSSIVVQIPDEPAGRLSPAPDGRLIERSRHGILPRIASDGARAVDVYARPAGTLPGGATPVGRVAIVVGGLGIGRNATQDAIARLPGAVTLAFAPYGADLDRTAASARSAGHEIMLQVPMEPFDYPDSDPGPHTLTVAARPADNMDHLHWAMGRFTGYVGLMNYMGAKLTADERALGPILREAGERGLGVLDDGSSSRSVLSTLGGETRTARAVVVLDAVPRADLIDKALEKLEAAAASGRVAVATASALPVTLDRIARWAERLEARGILLVPVSAALASGPPRASARR